MKEAENQNLREGMTMRIEIWTDSVPNFEGKREPWAKKSWWPLEIGKE